MAGLHAAGAAAVHARGQGRAVPGCLLLCHRCCRRRRRRRGGSKGGHCRRRRRRGGNRAVRRCAAAAVGVVFDADDRSVDGAAGPEGAVRRPERPYRPQLPRARPARGHVLPQLLLAARLQSQPHKGWWKPTGSHGREAKSGLCVACMHAVCRRSLPIIILFRQPGHGVPCLILCSPEQALLVCASWG